MRIDFHFHLAQRQHLLEKSAAFCDSFWEGRGDWSAHVQNGATLDAYLESEGLDYAVGLPEESPGVTGVVTNEFVRDNYKGSKRMIPFGTLSPDVLDDTGARIVELAGYGFRGLKLYPTYQGFYPNDKRLYPCFEEMAARGWPLMVHTGSSIFPGAKMKFGDPLLLDDIAVDFPGLNILIVHGGRGFWYDRAQFLTALHDNMYLEISGLPPKNLLKYFPNLKNIGHKVVFGSDWPGNPGIMANMEAVSALGLGPELTDLILGGTGARLLGLNQ